MATTSSAGPPLGKYLASTEKKTRDKAIKNLSVFLSDSQNVISKSEMDKLWKGIFYCFWMSDKPLVQQALATELAELLLTITSTSASLAFLRGFWETTVREWNGIDRLRIDKYYMLIRRFINATFRLLLRENWEEGACQQYNEILTRQSGPLCPNDIRVPASLAYHIADVYAEELNKALAAEKSPSPAPLGTVLEPFIFLAARTPTTVTYKRIQSALFEPLFAALAPESIAEEEPRKSKRIRLTAEASYPEVLANSCFSDPKLEGSQEGPMLKKKLLQKIFEVASQPETRDSSRRKMYALWKENYEEDPSDE
ncbi:Ribosomal RNA processing protein 1-like protein B [Psilocybe cubensis]|uniref:Ribosomal RNA processing protein 1-like protein B n=2 Tax=Psilocybe cubensis TaxID=181762 RepID=A0ACB8HEQ6_PSICU|nr:Ribosomal RNA processing protein 1-like protein B [Psilocybe cubensis]KAH9486505.1 Ribosomal RNA processing protein 1-like protein B [Psilocybe cubensis]